jgi:hypothetical protein
MKNLLSKRLLYQQAELDVRPSEGDKFIRVRDLE